MPTIISDKFFMSIDGGISEGRCEEIRNNAEMGGMKARNQASW